MFGKLFKSGPLVAFILLGFCAYIVSLYQQGDINLYIHPRYTNFTLIMSVLATLLLGAGLVIEVFKRRAVTAERRRVRVLDVVAVSVLGLAFILPAQALSSAAIERKSLNTPAYDSASTSNPDSKACPETKPETLEGWVYEIGRHPINCSQGQSIELTGFVYAAADKPLPSNMYYLGRVVMSCCVIDARPYALPVKAGSFERYPNETWLKVKGKLQPAEVNGTIQLVVIPESVVQVADPSQPYDYINTPSVTELQPVRTE